MTHLKDVVKNITKQMAQSFSIGLKEAKLMRCLTNYNFFRPIFN